MIACSKNRADIVALLLASGANSNISDTNNDRPLSIACWNRSIDVGIVRELLAHGASVDYPNSDGRSPLVDACRNHRADIVALLLSYYPHIDETVLASANDPHIKALLDTYVAMDIDTE